MLQLYRVQDINLDDIDLKNKYYDHFLKGEVNKAKKIIEDNPKLKSKVLSADSLNKIVNAILHLETLYYTDVEVVLDKKNFDYGIFIDELVYMTNYNDTLQYEKNNFVTYKNELYFCMKKPPIGTNPLNNTYWLYLGLIGETSYPPLGTKYVGKWVINENYNKFDMVVYKEHIYVAKTQNTNKVPIDNPNIWLLAMTKYPQGIYVSCGGAQGTKNGDLWVYINEKFNLTKNGRIYINKNEPMNFDLGDYWFKTNEFSSEEPYGLYISELEPKIEDLPTNTIWVEIKGFVSSKTSLYIAPYYPTIFKNGSIWIELIEGDING